MIDKQLSKRSPGFSGRDLAQRLWRAAERVIQGLEGPFSTTPWLPLALLPITTAISVRYWSAPYRLKGERQQEMRECIGHMREFYGAFQAYWRDHHGADPPSPMVLYPKYLKSLQTFVCPAYDSTRFTAPVAQQLRFGNRTVVNTYFFPYLELGNPDMRLRRERVPLVLCQIHSELTFEDAYRQVSRDRRAFERRYGVPTLVVLARDGKVRFFDALDIKGEGPAYSDFDLTGRSGLSDPVDVRSASAGRAPSPRRAASSAPQRAGKPTAAAPR